MKPVRVRVLCTGLIGTVWRVAGEVLEVSESEARGLHVLGRARLVDPREVPGSEAWPAAAAGPRPLEENDRSFLDVMTERWRAR